MIGVDAHASFEGPVDAVVPDNVTEHLLAVVREAVTNIGRHAQATRVTVDISVLDGHCRLRVADDGVGMATSTPGDGGLGLGNLRRRAEKLPWPTHHRKSGGGRDDSHMAGTSHPVSPPGATSPRSTRRPPWGAVRPDLAALGLSALAAEL